MRKFMDWRAALAVLALMTGAVGAHEGHDHGAPPPMAQALTPRVEATSPGFELLAVAEGGILTIWLDRYASNAPVTGAEIEIEGKAGKAVAEALGDGVYRAVLKELATPGEHDLVFAVAVGEEADLLAGRLTVPTPAAAAGDIRRGPWAWGTAIAAALLAVVIALMVRRRRSAAPLVLAAVIVLSIAPPVDAHEGHDHGAAAPAVATGDAPQRLPDGSVFLPKPTQRALGLRTELAVLDEHAAAVELQGRVAADPNAAGRVQAAFAGRIQPGPKGLPLPGQRVARGEVLAWLAPVAAGVDRGAARAQVADLDAQLATVEKRLLRYRELKDFVAKRDLEATEFEYAGLQRRRAAVMAGVDGREALVAPVSGVLARGNVVAGQIVDARELVFEIVDPRRLAVEAMAFDAGAVRGFAAAEAVGPGGERLPLRFLGAGRALLEQALPLLFRIEGETALPLGTPVKVLARAGERRPGVRLPAAALARGGAEAAVWLHDQAERFVQRRVVAAPLDAGHVLGTSGLEGGERVLVVGAAALAQVK